MTYTKPFAKRQLPPPVAIPEMITDPLDSALDDTVGAPDPLEPPEAPPETQRSLEEQLARSTRRLRRMLFALGLMTIALAAAAWWWADNRPETATPDEVDAAIAQTLSTTTLPAPIGPSIYNAVIPSVVVIQTGEGEQGSIGTGVVINEAGNILTSLHVVDGGGPIRITYADGTPANAVIAEADASIDTAVLTTDRSPEVLVPAVLGGTPQIGDPVFAIGNPLGLGGSFSAGVVSGLERTMPISEDVSLEGLIQFDAAVNPGNSGGPLVDRSGQVVGIVTALANPTGEDFFSGIGFAVPIAVAGGPAGGPQQ